MRPALFLSALLATALFGGTALAERTSDDNSGRHVSNAQDLKERVLHERGESRTSERTSASRGEHTSSKVERFRAKGENYEQFGHSGSGATSSASSKGSSASKMLAAKIMPGRSHGDVVDGKSGNSSSSSSKGMRATVGSTQSTWTAGGKNVRSFVHSTNDKGQTNNNIRGATASAMKMRHVAKIIMATAVPNQKVKVFSWTSSGGDGQSLFPGN